MYAISRKLVPCWRNSKFIYQQLKIEGGTGFGTTRVHINTKFLFHSCIYDHYTNMLQLIAICFRCFVSTMSYAYHTVVYKLRMFILFRTDQYESHRQEQNILHAFLPMFTWRTWEYKYAVWKWIFCSQNTASQLYCRYIWTRPFLRRRSIMRNYQRPHVRGGLVVMLFW